MNRPNVVLITVDQMRRDCMGISGNPVVETPNLDSMRWKGFQFTNAYSATPSCIPARAALMTGQSQRRHGRVGYQEGITWDYIHTLAGEFAASGYHTQCVGKMHVHPERNLMGFHNVVLHDGFHLYSRISTVPQGESQAANDDYLHWLKQVKGADTDLNDSGMGCNSWVARPFPYEEKYHPTNWCVSESIDFLRRKDPSKPFFLYASFVRPHSPLDPPQYYFDMYDRREDIPEAFMGDWTDQEDAAQDGLNVDAKKGIIPKEALHRARAAYYGHITHIDHQIGRLLQAIMDDNLMKNTVVVFTSDHGDMLGDHNLFRKALPYEGSAGIPLLIYDPYNLLKVKQNRKLNCLTELRDIMPTLLDIAGIPTPGCVDGKSLLPVLRGEQEQVREYLHGEHSYRDMSNHFIVTPKDKYIWFSQSGEEQYFDLEHDPNELHNAIFDPNAKERIEYLRRCLIHELDGREEGYTDGGKLIPGQKPLSMLSRRWKD